MSEYSSFIKDLDKRLKDCKIDSSNPLFINSILTINNEVLNSSIIGWILHLNDGKGRY